jgi:excisionase family DNA binding protein
MNTSTPGPLMTTVDVSLILRVCTKKVRQLVKRGDLAAHRFGKDFRFSPADVEIFLSRERLNDR